MITQELGERVRDAKEVGDKISLPLTAAEVQLLNKLGIVSDFTATPQNLYRPGSNFILFCSVVFAERVDEVNLRLKKDGGIRSLARVTEILTEVDHLPDPDAQPDDDSDEDLDEE